MKPRVKPEDFPELEQVLTLAQACREYGVYRQTLTYAIDAGLLAAVRSGRQVIISRRSLKQYLFTSQS